MPLRSMTTTFVFWWCTERPMKPCGGPTTGERVRSPKVWDCSRMRLTPGLPLYTRKKSPAEHRALFFFTGLETRNLTYGQLLLNGRVFARFLLQPPSKRPSDAIAKH